MKLTTEQTIHILERFGRRLITPEVVMVPGRFQNANPTFCTEEVTVRFEKDMGQWSLRFDPRPLKKAVSDVDLAPETVG